MATIVDQLIVTLTLDNSGLRRTRQEAEDNFRQIVESFRKHGLSIEATAKSVGYGLDSLRLGFLALGLAAAAALKGIKDIADQAASNTALARHAGVVHKTTEEYALLRQTQENFAKGGGAALDQFSDKYTQAVEQFKLTGDWPEQFNYLRGLHISPVDPVTGKWKDFEQVMKEVAAATRSMNDAEAKAWGEGNGIAWVTLSFYRQSNDEIRKQSEETRRIGVLNKEQVKASQEIWTSWSQTLQTIENLTNTGMVSFKNEILEILKDVRDIVAEFKFLFGLVTDITELLNKITGNQKSVSGSDPLGIGGWTERMIDGIFGPGASQTNLGGLGRRIDKFLGTEKSSATEGSVGSEYLKSERQRFAEEMRRDPELRLQVAAAASLEDENDVMAVTESLMNRMAYTKQTLRQGLFSGFYGPINRGELGPRMSALERDPNRLARINAQIDAVLAGSNIIEGRTDQGLPTDPNGMWPGGRIIRHGEVFNDWGGGPGGHAGAAAFREEQQRHVRAAAMPNLPPAGTNAFVDRYSGINSTMSTTNNSAHIENMTVNTNVTDAVGFAKEVGGALDSHAFSSNANNGPQ